ncbi:FecCD family ABC transporter permease [Nonomuraea sp. NPDC050663]|uniref:FecCD family ABC transporter permease n=1 Tax=Nonomuraea sp. NPDC050663 TaxID=3364370 RepID=UPI0037B760BC
MRWTGLGLCLAVLALVAGLSIAVGAQSLDPATVWQVLWHPDAGQASSIVHDLRIPRTLLGLCVGAALGLSGAIMQALTRNPLADPGLLGVNMGASLAVVCAIMFFGVEDLTVWVWFSMAGALLAAVAVHLIGADHLVLAGAAISACLLGAVNAALSLDAGVFDQWRYWDVGALNGRSMEIVVQVAPFVAAGTLLALALGGGLNALSLGEDVGRSLGLRLSRTKILAALAVTLLCGAATAAAGPIGFIGLMAPHAVRAFTGADHRWVLAFSAVVAPALLLAADVLGRVIVRPAELESGIVTAFVGAPIFIYLLRRRRFA